MSYLCQKCKNGVHRIRFRDKAYGKLPSFEKLAHVAHHGLPGFRVKKIEGESTEANDFNYIL